MVYTEADLIVPALQVMKENPSGVKTSLLIEKLTRRLKPTGRDAQILHGRRDTYFSQKVRNLKSHDSLIRRGLATYENRIWKITQKGRKLLEENSAVFESLISQGFNRRGIEREIENDFSGITIEEGAMEERTSKQRKRSNKLKRIALREFKRNGRLSCEACGFDFERKYGEHGKDFIEIHHKEPIHEADISGRRSTLEEALRKVSPLCSNCHRIVHRKRGKMLSVERLKEIIRDSSQRGLGSF